ncbi:MAG: T9SS type A sorting domain-containing protein [Chitinophagales bacterium]
MKKFFTLFCLVASVCALNAQNTYRPMDAASASKMKTAPSVTKKSAHVDASRSATTSFILDYDGNDETYATNMTYDYTRYIWEVNRRYGNADNLNMDYAAVYYNNLQYVDGNNTLQTYPLSKSTLTLDSFDILFIHNHTTGTGTYDSLTFTVWQTGTETVTNYGQPNATFVTPKIWDTTIVVNASIPLNTTNYTVATFYPNVTLPKGKGFGIRVDFAGDTANKFEMLAGYRDQCAAACFAETSIAGNNSAYYLNLTTSTGSNLSGYFENAGASNIFYDCDASGGFTAGGCENFPIQNWVIPAYVTDVIDYGVEITADSLKGCPNSTLTLNANAFGSSATPYTYSWTTTSGNLSSTTDPSVDLTIGTGNATVIVVVTDANNVTTADTVIVQSKGINITINNANPLTINCGASATITTSISGTTTGKNYSWSTGASGATASTVTVQQPGTYSVTVTNNSGCSASASLAVQYPGGLGNNVNFAVPNPPNCAGKPITFVNTSQRTSGWNFSWTFGDNNTGFSQDGVNTYAAAGQFNVKLTMDSAGCSFSSTTKAITILPATNAACVTGIEDVTFGGGVAIVPNPSNGNVQITVNSVEKNLSIRVYNVIGSEVKAFSTTDVASSFNKSFDFSDLANGTYLVKVQSADKTAVKRLTISK